jgi:diguanylate cyclase (GGDEF)-like protein
MNVRRRLIGGFVGIAAFVLILFAFVTYRAVIDLDSSENLAMLQNIAVTAAGTLAEVPSDQLTASTLEKTFPYADDLNTEAIIITGQNQLISKTNIGKTDKDKIAELDMHKKNHGQYDSNQLSFHWVSAPIPGRDAYLLLMQRDLSRVSEYPRKLGVRLFITVFMIIWLAIWAALLISTRIVRRLDEQNSALIHQTLHDELTGLPNRHQLFDYLHQRTSIEKERPCALFVFDINDFKEINDTLGHSAGDELLIAWARRLPKILPDAELIARLGGDEFAIVLPNNDHETLTNLALRLQDRLLLPLETHGLNVSLSPSIGCAIYPEHTNTVNDLIRRAEVAMYRAKSERNVFTIYHSDFDPHSIRRLSLMADFKRAIDAEELVLHFQPKVEFNSNYISGVETLVRWQHPEHGLVPPDDFVPIAEQSDMVADFTFYVIDKALAQCRCWIDQGKHLSVAVNLSANTLRDKHMPEHIHRLLREHSVPAKLLKLEITESAIMADPEQALATLRDLQNLGIALSIDDFGTGYSSMAYLKQLPASELKIDKAFVQYMLNSDNDKMIVHTIITLAHNLGYKVVAEGIEDRETYDYLESLNCDHGQGYFISRPLPIDKLDNWISTSAWQF